MTEIVHMPKLGFDMSEGVLMKWIAPAAYIGLLLLPVFLYSHKTLRTLRYESVS